MASSRGFPDVEPPVPSPMFGQIVIVLLGVPVQLAVNVPVVDGAPPTPKFTLPKLMLVIVKLQDWALAKWVTKNIITKEMRNNLKDIAMAQSRFEW